MPVPESVSISQVTNNWRQIAPGARWMGDYLGARDTMLPGGIMLDPAAFLGADNVEVTVGVVGGANGGQGDTAIAVSALSGAIPSGTILDFGPGKFARTTADAAAGAVSVVVEALPADLVQGDTALYEGAGGAVRVISGTVVGRTYAEREADAQFGPAAVDGSDAEIYIVAFDLPDVTGSMPGTGNEAEAVTGTFLIKENFLPGWSTMAAALKAQIRATYRTTQGV